MVQHEQNKSIKFILLTKIRFTKTHIKLGMESYMYQYLQVREKKLATDYHDLSFKLWLEMSYNLENKEAPWRKQ